jgi:hypothetical protein
MLTFRSAAAGYFDLSTDEGTGNWGGFRSSCTANLIPADGVLNAPDYTRTCTCSYQNQCSLALIHMPDVETWTFSAVTRGRERVKQVGINFGAPGDRRADDGTLWLDYPSVGGHSPDPPVSVEGEQVTYERVHSSAADGQPNWVFASQARGVRRLQISLAHGSQAAPPEKYRVRLFFSTGSDQQGQSGKILVQGREYAEVAAGSIVTYPNVEIGHELTLSFETPQSICGIEIVHQSLVEL